MDGYDLTTQDIRALRNADAVCFDLRKDGTAGVRAILRAEHSSTGFEQTHTIEASTRLANYGDEGPAFTGFHMVMHAKVDDVYRTLVRHLRPGMQIHLHWVRDNNNDLIRNAGLHQDELKVRIGKVDGKTGDTFLMAQAVRQDNTARMIRVAY